MPPRILIAIPALDFMPTICARGLLALCAYPLKDRLSGKPIPRPNVGFQMGSLIMDARNVLAEEALKLDASHIFFLDSDILVPPDALQRLLSRRKPIIGASYVKRVAEGDELSGLIGRPEPSQPIPDIRDGLQRMHTLPFGCMLIETAVFGKLSRPYFNYAQGPTPERSMSEDSYFCLRAREAGFTIYQDTTLSPQLAHVGLKVFRP